MCIRESDFLISAFTEENPFIQTKDFSAWFESRKAANPFTVTEIPFAELSGWNFSPFTGNLRHATDRFFSIEGLWVNTTYGPVAQWSQPIINQPEIGVLGFLTKKFNDILYFLMQVKLEPGNINGFQLSPTVQATHSNFMRVHNGKRTPYLEYFLENGRSRVPLDSLQTEQGARFLRKRNRNMIVFADGDVEVLEDFCWLTLGQIQKFLKRDHTLSMDARTVLSLIPYTELQGRGSSPQRKLQHVHDACNFDLEGAASRAGDFSRKLLASALNTEQSLHSVDEIIHWLTDKKVRYSLDVERIPLKYVTNWRIEESQIVHESKRFFSVIAVQVEAQSREVKRWTQPIIKPQEQGIVAYLVKEIDGILHFLMQAKVEPGNFDAVAMAPTVQCITGSYKDVPAAQRPPFLDYVLRVDPSEIRVDSMQSEEGGRFYQEANRNLVIEVGRDFPLAVPDNYVWVTLDQLKRFIKYTNFINVQARCLLSCLGFK